MTIPPAAINRLADRLWIHKEMSQQAATDKALATIEDAIATIASAGGKIVWEEV